MAIFILRSTSYLRSTDTLRATNPAVRGPGLPPLSVALTDSHSSVTLLPSKATVTLKDSESSTAIIYV